MPPRPQLQGFPGTEESEGGDEGQSLAGTAPHSPLLPLSLAHRILMLGPASLSPHPLLLPVVTCLSQEASCQGGESRELLILIPEGWTREDSAGEWV